MSNLYYFSLLGDILIYDTKLFHYGSANKSTEPRALLAFSFQSCTPWGSTEKINGFTYHCHPTINGKYRVEDFIAKYDTDIN